MCRKIVTQNWLLNPTGKENAFVEIDLVQEHLNFWIKVSKHVLTLQQKRLTKIDSVFIKLKAVRIPGLGWPSCRHA
jgi:hypothetical protein